MRSVVNHLGASAAVLACAIAFAIVGIVVGQIVADGFATLGRPHVG